MNKNTRIYAITWLMFLAIFNVVVFIIPPVLPDSEKYTFTFWIGYVFITLSFVIHLICALIALKETNISKMFYKIPLFSLSYAGLIASFTTGSVCIKNPSLPYWIGIVVCAVALVANVYAVITAGVAASTVIGIDKKVKAQTFFVKSLTADAQNLINRSEIASVKDSCQKVYEAIRYSDPMSSELLASIEEQIAVTFGEFSEAVKSKNESANVLASELIQLIEERNQKCRLLK